jgi:predicted MFS family arabinose efflux permease
MDRSANVEAELAEKSLGAAPDKTNEAAAKPAPPWWSPFRQRSFTVIWAASTASLIGIAMSDTASGWLMTSLDADPTAVALVQTAANLPMFLFTLPAGALADIFDPRRFLLIVESTIAILTVTLATMVALRAVSPTTLLVMTFVLSAVWTMAAPAWLSIAPQLVPRSDLDAATAVNGASYNVSRALGPALSGLLIGLIGVAAPFWAFGASNFGSVAALLWWRGPRKNLESLPVERLAVALRSGVRHAANNQHLRSTLVRTLAFFPFASAYWALMPLTARSLMPASPEYFGVMLGSIGAGAMAGALMLNWLKAKLGPDRLVAAGTLVTAAALALFALVRDPGAGATVCVMAGAAWIVVLASLYVSAQVALPDWVRGRGLAIFLTVIFGAMTAGSASWGKVAEMSGLPVAHLIAAAGVALAIPLTWRWKVQTGAELDLTPSMHWRPPHVDHRIENKEGPVLVTVEYRIDFANRSEFLKAVTEMGRERKRDGAYAWGVFEDATDKERYCETFLIESWLEFQHLRERVTKADRVLEDRVRSLVSKPAQVTFLVASRPDAHRLRQ